MLSHSTRKDKMMSTIPPETKQQTSFEQDVRQFRRRRNRMRAMIGALVLLCAIVTGAFIYGMIAWATSVTSPVRGDAGQYYAAIIRKERCRVLQK
jgi:hypothetical protein